MQCATLAQRDCDQTIGLETSQFRFAAKEIPAVLGCEFTKATRIFDGIPLAGPPRHENFERNKLARSRREGEGPPAGSSGNHAPTPIVDTLRPIKAGGNVRGQVPPIGQ